MKKEMLELMLIIHRNGKMFLRELLIRAIILERVKNR